MKKENLRKKVLSSKKLCEWLYISLVVSKYVVSGF